MNRITSGVILAMCFFLSGCEIIMRGIMEAGADRSPCWNYKATAHDSSNVRFDRIAAVLPFAEGRSDERRADNFFTCFIPVAVLYCGSTYSRPETGMDFVKPPRRDNRPGGIKVFDPHKGFAMALAEELQSKNLFRETFYAPKPEASDLVISGTIHDMTMNQTMYSYGLSFLAAPAWMLLPVGSIENELSVELTCQEASSGRRIFSRLYAAPHYHKIVWMYAIPNSCHYAEMLREIYAKFIEDLTAALIADQARLLTLRWPGLVRQPEG